MSSLVTRWSPLTKRGTYNMIRPYIEIQYIWTWISNYWQFLTHMHLHSHLSRILKFGIFKVELRLIFVFANTCINAFKNKFVQILMHLEIDKHCHYPIKKKVNMNLYLNGQTAVSFCFFYYVNVCCTNTLNMHKYGHFWSGYIIPLYYCR